MCANLGRGQADIAEDRWDQWCADNGFNLGVARCVKMCNHLIYHNMFGSQGMDNEASCSMLRTLPNILAPCASSVWRCRVGAVLTYLHSFTFLD